MNARETLDATGPPATDLASFKRIVGEIVRETDEEVARLLIEVHRVTANSELLERRRTEIVNAAYEAFARDGYHATSVSDIARIAGIDKRTLYDYVANKEDVLYLLFLHFLPRQLGRLAGAVRDEGGPCEQLRSIVHEHLRYIDDHAGMVLLSYREMRYLRRAQISNLLWIVDRIMLLYESVLTWGEAVGVMSCETPRIAAHALRAAVDMPGLSGWDLDRFSLADTERTVAELFLNGLKTPSHRG